MSNTEGSDRRGMSVEVRKGNNPVPSGGSREKERMLLLPSGSVCSGSHGNTASHLKNYKP